MVEKTPEEFAQGSTALKPVAVLRSRTSTLSDRTAESLFGARSWGRRPAPGAASVPRVVATGYEPPLKGDPFVQFPPIKQSMREDRDDAFA
jgi:hypothetical protein